MGKLTEQIRADMTESMKARTAEKTSTLRMLQAALKNEQINAGHELSDEEALAVIRKAVKQRQDSIEQYTSGNRPELAAIQDHYEQVYTQQLARATDFRRDRDQSLVQRKTAIGNLGPFVQHGCDAAPRAGRCGIVNANRSAAAATVSAS